MTQANIRLAIAAGFVLAGSAFGQDVISAKSGLVHHIQGDVYLGETLIKQKLGDYPVMKAGDNLRTEDGLAEVLLTPGVFLRVAENSEIAMLKNALTDTRLDIVKGSVILEASEIAKEHSIELTVQGSALEMRKRGVFRIDAGTPPRIRVYDGEGVVTAGGQSLTVKEGREITLAGVPEVTKFRKEDTDAFYRWAGRRSGYLTVANISAARQLQMSGASWNMSNWYFNPYFGMFTYIPLRGLYRNAWNHSYYSPGAAYRPPPLNMDPGGFGSSGGYAASSRGMPDMSGRSYGGGGYSGGGYQAPATSTPSSAGSVGAPRTGDSGGSRSGGARGGR